MWSQLWCYMGEQQHRPLPPQPPEQSTQDPWHIQAIGLPTKARHFGYWAHIFASSIINLGVIPIWLWCLAPSICPCISSIAHILREPKSQRLVKVTDSRVSSPSRVSTPSRDRQRLYYVLTEHENKQNFVGKCIIFQAPNNVAANVFRNVKYVRCNKQYIYLSSLDATHEEADPRAILHCNMSMSSTIGITSNVGLLT